jgi:hypothetical protein
MVNMGNDSNITDVFWILAHDYKKALVLSATLVRIMT